jgi:hypothetical protein
VQVAKKAVVPLPFRETNDYYDDEEMGMVEWQSY